ncbi:helix-turn-helix transcriptional regulator [Paenibacillus tritici]|uniref:helix-turn-helix domain-containing protein n=1 Tax=Paenibacillus tritici TaxID=1873425 RepID=UPI001BAD30DD|nr:helix-turn-helix transcriptional regulator [Paenibacillus tritici]QUL54125.1 helix-turn-helix transcriptional regulator [Paenibacillus tritici]
MEATTTTILGELEEYLRQKALTITQFAKRSQLHSGTLSNILHGYRPIAMQQLDRITQAMGQEEGFFYDLYIDNYIIGGSSDGRRIGPLLLRCADLNKLDSMQRIARHILDNLMYAPLLFDIAEEMLTAGKMKAAAMIYEIVAEAERYQHSERLALCQFRLFTISLSDDQDRNLWAANRFEPFVERLDEVDQLHALKELANTYRSLQRWDKVDEFASTMGHKARIQYDLKYHSDLKSAESGKLPIRPLFFYIAYSDLLRGNVCDELGDYEGALGYKDAYADLSWVREQGDAVEHWKNLFHEWSKANIYITKLLSGDTTVLESYVAYIDKHRNELVIGLLYILRAANKNQLNIDRTLEFYQQEVEEILIELIKSRYSRNLAMDRQANLIYELAYYYLYKEEYTKGFDLLLKTIINFQHLNNERNVLECVTLFERFRNVANQEIQDQYQTQLLGGVCYEEKSSCTSNGF